MSYFPPSPIRLIAVDLDGTLLNPKGEVTPFTRQVISQALQASVQVVICTGRNLPELRPIYEALPQVRYYAGGNGGILWDRQGEKMLYENLLSFPMQKEILSRLEGIDSMLELFTKDHIYCDQKCIRRLSRYGVAGIREIILKTRTPVEDIRSFILSRGEKALKINQFFPSDAEREKAKASFAGLEADCCSSIGCNLECNAKGANKGDALAHLVRHLRLSPEQVMAIGDGNNDLPMLRYAGLGVAMENALEEVKAAAKAITNSNRQEGAAKAILQYTSSSLSAG